MQPSTVGVMLLVVAAVPALAEPLALDWLMVETVATPENATIRPSVAPPAACVNTCEPDSVAAIRDSAWPRSAAPPLSTDAKLTQPDLLIATASSPMNGATMRSASVTPAGSARVTLPLATPAIALALRKAMAMGDSYGARGGARAKKRPARKARWRA